MWISSCFATAQNLPIASLPLRFLWRSAILSIFIFQPYTHHSLVLSSASLPFCYPVSVTLASLLLLKHPKGIRITGHLHMLLPLNLLRTGLRAHELHLLSPPFLLTHTVYSPNSILFFCVALTTWHSMYLLIWLSDCLHRMSASWRKGFHLFSSWLYPETMLAQTKCSISINGTNEQLERSETSSCIWEDG